MQSKHLFQSLLLTDLSELHFEQKVKHQRKDCQPNTGLLWNSNTAYTESFGVQ